VGVKKEKFTIKDVYNIYGYMSLVLLWQKIRSVNDGHTHNKYGIEYLKDLGLDGALTL
jgi:penicillin amidase